MSDLKDSSTLASVGGWIVAIAGFLVTIAKVAYDRATKRDEQEHAIKKDVLEHRQEITSGEIAVRREEERDLIKTLKEGQEKQEREIAELREEVKALRGLREADIATTASLRAERDADRREIERLERDLKRVRDQRDRFREIAEQGERYARQRGLGYAETLACEISEVAEADDAASQTRRAAP